MRKFINNHQKNTANDTIIAEKTKSQKPKSHIFSINILQKSQQRKNVTQL